MISSNPVAHRTRFATFFLLVLILLLSFSPGSATDSTDNRRREADAQKFVNQKLQIWQERLNLKGWNIKARLVRQSALEPGTLGNVNWDTAIKKAEIGVLSTLDYTLSYDEMLADMEFTVVHELVHLQLASLPRSEASRSTEEHAVNELSSALLRLANGK